MGSLAQAACVAALSDQAYLMQTVLDVAAARERLYQIALDNDIQSIPSATNFVALDCGRDGEFASTVLQHLIGNGIFVRMPGIAPLNRCIRVSVGEQKDLDQFAEALKGALKAVSG